MLRTDVITRITRATLVVIISKMCLVLTLIHCSNSSTHYRQAVSQGCEISTLMANHETLLDTASSLNSLGHSPKATEIFHCDSASSKGLPGLKRKFGESEREREGGRAKISSSQASLISPPLFKPRPNLAMVPGYPHEAAPLGNTGGVSREQEAGPGQEDEWKNIKVVRQRDYT